MKVTVILPVYTVQNSNRTREAIESILNQSYKNLELVVVSELTETLEHIKRICVSKRLTLLHSTRQGLGACLNLAISETNAKFIARMDDDDVALPDRIEKQVKYLINNNLDLVGSGIEYMTKKKTIRLFPERHNDLHTQLFFYCPLAHPTVLAKRNFFIMNKYNEDLSVCEDLELWFRTIDDYKFGNVPEVLLKYRISPTQLTSISGREVHIQEHQLRKSHRFRLRDLFCSRAFLKLNFSFESFQSLALIYFSKIFNLTRSTIIKILRG